jgi:transcriptional regulator with XRE-family HTH domain
MQLNARMKNIREFLGKSQKEMAVDVGVSVTAWQNYENGDQYPGGKVLEALARLGIDVNWLLICQGQMERATKLTEIGGEPIPQPLAEHLDKRLLALALRGLMPVFDEFNIKNYDEQAGVITDVYSTVLERHMERTQKSVDDLALDIRSFFKNFNSIKKFSNLFKFINKS